MNTRAYNVLFVCTGNSARSILAETLTNHWGRGQFAAFSAGSHPRDRVHPLALELLEQRGLPIAGLRSKSWDEFAGPEALPLDFVFIVCAHAAGEYCPQWPGQPMTAHWCLADHAACEGSAIVQREAFLRAYVELERRIKAFTSLSVRSLSRASLQQQVEEIAQAEAGQLVSGTRGLSQHASLYPEELLETIATRAQPGVTAASGLRQYRERPRRKPEAILDLGPRHHDDRAGCGHLIEIAHDLDLEMILLEQPGFRFHRRGRIRVERFVSDCGDLALVEQELDCGE
jgi:arsenate reductase